MTSPPSPAPLYAVVLAGGRGSRLGGVEKAGLVLDGRRLLDHALAAVAAAAEVVVVGDPTPTPIPVRFCREEPAHSGPAAALLAGFDALGLHAWRSAGPGAAAVAVLAVDMPWVGPPTVARLADVAAGRDGARLIGPDGRGQLAMVLDAARLAAVAPPAAARPGLAVHALLAGLDLVAVPAQGEEHRDVDTWADLPDGTPCQPPGPPGRVDP